MDEFQKLGIADYILRALQDQGYQKPTLIQHKAIPLVLAGKDIIGQSATGTGKTLAFGVGILQGAEQGKGIQALILTPTRELAEQVTKALWLYSKHKPLRIVMVFGGVAIEPQFQALKTAEVVVGTPGRILDHLQRRTIDLQKVKILVLDEADRMLDMGFIEDVERIIHKCPRQHQTMLFSATIPQAVVRLAQRYMQQPVTVGAEAEVDPTKLRQAYYNVQEHLKLSLLVHLLKHEKAGLVMVFCNSRTTADFVVTNLNKVGIDAEVLHGGFSQGKRKRAMTRFHTQRTKVLVCTDLAARGLDIEGVSHVYNYDTPKESKQYIHRIGRTARAGKEGIAITLLARRDHDNFDRILRTYPVRVERMETPYVEEVHAQRSHLIWDSPGARRGPRRDGRGFSGRRPNFKRGPRRSHQPRRD